MPDTPQAAPEATQAHSRTSRFPLLFKVLAVGGVLLALMLSLHSIGGIVQEREGRLHEAEHSVANSLASQQQLLGPVIERNCTEVWESVQGEGKEKKSVTERRDFTLAAVPQALDVNAKATIEPRYRGIFKVNGFATKATLNAHWQDLSALRPVPEHAESRLICQLPNLLVAVGDSRGIRSALISVPSARLAVVPGTQSAARSQGFHAVLPAALVDADTPLAAVVTLDLVGTGELMFAPVAETTHIELASDWPHPSFGGRFLPATRAVDEKGFTASWDVSALATSAPHEYMEGHGLCSFTDGAGPACIDTLGVSFMDPISNYTLADRATKYGLLFVALTFIGVGLVEVLRRLRVHPVQYLLVGSAIAIFFLLLVSLTEHVAFAWGYLAASAASSLLLAFYGSFVLQGWRPGLLFGTAIGGLYGALYVLLQLEQTALVLGSVLLFVVLAGVMAATRKVDWYALFGNLRSEAAPRSAGASR